MTEIAHVLKKVDKLQSQPIEIIPEDQEISSYKKQFGGEGYMPILQSYEKYKETATVTPDMSQVQNSLNVLKSTNNDQLP